MEYFNPNNGNAPTAATGEAFGKAIQQGHDTSKRPVKWRRVLFAFASGRSWNRFEAERELHDHCLHTTVSTIQHKGIPVSRKDEIVPGFQGIPTHVSRYWLEKEALQRARELLGIVAPIPSPESPPEAVLAASWACPYVPVAAGCAR